MIKENFLLKKIKVKSDGLAEVAFNVAEAKEGAVYNSDVVKKMTLPIHPDLESLIKELNTHLRSVFNFDSLRRFAESDEMKIKTEEFLKHISTLITPSGISISGSQEKKSVVITGSLTVSNNQKVAINTNRISLAGSKQGIEEELERITSEIEEEVYLYLFESKTAELTIPYEEADEDEYEPNLFSEESNQEDNEEELNEDGDTIDVYEDEDHANN